MKNYVLNSGDFSLVNERKGIVNREGNASALIQLGNIRMSDNTTVEGREFVKVVNSALAFFEAKYPFEYRYISGSPVIYLLDDSFCNTMAVDDRGVLYINVGFLYNKAPFGLNMQPGSVCNILYHECMHTFLSHVSRSIVFNEKHNDKKLTWKDMNIAADLEVNSTMVIDKVCTENFWDTYKGCYDKSVVGLPMESIAANYKNIIDKFKSQPPQTMFGNQMNGQNVQSGQGNQDDMQTQQDNDDKKDYSEMNAQEAAQDAERSADSAQLSADDAKRNFGENSQQAKDAQNAADKAKDAADKAKDAANKGDAKEAQNQAKEAANQASKAGQASNRQQNQQNSQQGNNQNGTQGQSSNKNDDGSQTQSGKDYSKMTAQEAAQDATASAKQAQAAANMAKKWSGENSQQAKDAQEAANNAKTAAEKSVEAASNRNTKEAQGQAREAAREARKACDAAKNSINQSKGNNKKESKGNKSDLTNSSAGNGMGDNGKSLYDAELHSGNGSKQTLIGEILRKSDVNSNLKKSLENSGFDKDTIDDVCEEVYSLKPKSSEELSALRNSIIKGKPKSGLAKICTDIKISNEVVDNVWEEIVKKFLESNTLFMGKRKKTLDRKHIKWGDRRTLGIDMIRPYHPKGDATPQNINVLVDTSGSIDMNTTLLFAQTLANCCDKLEYSGITLIPFATVVDEKSAVYFTGDEAKNDKEAIINRVVEMATNNNAGGGTRIVPCVETILKYSQSEPKSVWIIFTDGEFVGEKSLKKLLTSSNRILFVIYNKKFEERFKSWLKWCIDPDYEQLSKCYIDLDKQH